MKILFISNYYYPHIGGVEKHVLEVGKKLLKSNTTVNVLTSKYRKNLKDSEVLSGINIFRISYPKIKFFGLLVIWVKILFTHLKLIDKAKIVHVHDVFVWYLPFRILFPRKKVYVTHHGWEGKYPIPLKNILFKKIANKLSTGSICVGEYIENYYGIRFDEIVYGGVVQPKRINKKEKRIVFLGRLEKDTGLLKALPQIVKYRQKGYKVDFVGDGRLRRKCEEFGTVHGFTNPKPYLEKAKVCIPSGYLSCLEAFSYKCEVEVFWQNRLKKDYWRMTPFYNFIQENDIEGACKWAKRQSWRKISETYIKLWK